MYRLSYKRLPLNTTTKREQHRLTPPKTYTIIESAPKQKFWCGLYNIK